MSTHKHPGRLRGGLSRITDRMHLLRFLRSHREGLGRIGWAVAEGAIGVGIGILGVSLWLALR